MMKILITGGAGFIGSALVRYLLKETGHSVLVVDKLTYAGNMDSLSPVANHAGFHFLRADICDQKVMEKALSDFKPDTIMHLAAESHVDRSIDGPAEFMQTNIIGTYALLEASRRYYNGLSNDRRLRFRFHHISTDEVYGDLGDSGGLFTESTPYDPSSPYSASKAASDHLVRAWQRTYNLPVIVSNCSNNYGPYHFPEKLIPLMILNALAGKPLPVYGKGQQIRDWLYVEDHARGLYKVVTEGKIGETYNIGGHNERKNIDVVRAICSLLDQLVSDKPAGISSFTTLITFVEDRPGHDMRYAIDSEKIERKLGWKPQETFESGLLKTVQWFLANPEWWQRILSGAYAGKRQGLAK